MKKSELRQIIREEISKVVKESTSSSIEEKISKLFRELVPSSGSAATINGEMVRAANRVGYRFNNDGDKFYSGYGTETVGPVIAFLTNCPEIDPQIQREIRKEVKNIEYNSNDQSYEKFLNTLYTLVIKHVETIEDKPTDTDMYDYTSDYEEEEEDEDDDYEYDYEDDY